MQPHAGVAQVFGTNIAGVLFTNRNTFRILFFYFPPTDRCLFGWSVDDILGALFGQSVCCLPAKQVNRPYMPPTKARTSAPTSAPTKAPTSVQTRIFKAFRVGQKLAISAEGCHCSGQLLRAITSSTVLSW